MADAQYIIDIATNLEDGEHTAAELDALSRSIQGMGRDAEDMQQAVKMASTELDAARAATSAANTELAEARAEYSSLEKAAVRMAKAAERAALKNGGVVPDELQANLDRAQAELREYATDMSRLERAAADAAQEQERWSRTLRNTQKITRHVTDTLGDATTNVSTFRGALGDVGGPVGELGERLLMPVQAFVDLNERFGRAKALAVVVAVGITAVVAAVVTLTAALVAGVGALAAYAVKLADTRREAALAAEAFEALKPEVEGIEWAMITRETGIEAEQLRALSKSLLGAKVSAEQLPDALRAAAFAESALGQGGAAEFIAQIKSGKLTVDEFANAVEQKFGGIVERKMMGLGEQSVQLQRNIASIFGGLNIDPVLEGFSVLVSLFDKGTVAGEALAFIFESLFQPLIDGADEAAFVIEAFVLGVEIGFLKMYLKIKPALNFFRELFGLDNQEFPDTLELAKQAGEALGEALFVLVAVLGVLAIAFVEQTKNLIRAIQFFRDLKSAILEGVSGAIESAIGFLQGVDLAELGKNIMLGLIGGITGSAGAVRDAVKSAVGSAISAAKSVLGIASPSKVFAKLGGFTAEGFAQGVDQEVPTAQESLSRLVSPPSVSSASGGDSASAVPQATSGASGGIDLRGSVWNISGVANADQAADRVAEALTRLLEGDAAQVGAT